MKTYTARLLWRENTTTEIEAESIHLVPDVYVATQCKRVQGIAYVQVLNGEVWDTYRVAILWVGPPLMLFTERFTEKLARAEIASQPN